MAGGFSGYSKNSSFEKCHTKGKVEQVLNHYDLGYGCVRSGGITGIAYNCTFTDCTNEAEIIAVGYSFASAAGIAADVNNKCIFNNCVNQGIISAEALYSSSGGWALNNNIANSNA